MKQVYTMFIILLFAAMQIYSKETKQQCLLMFMDNQGKEVIEIEDINVAHQFVTALIQKAAPIFVSQSLWSYIWNKKKKFAQKIKDSTSVEHALLGLYQTTCNVVVQGYDQLDLLNSRLHSSWYQTYFPQLSSVDFETLKPKLFDMFCYLLFFSIEDWNVYHLETGYLLFVPMHQSHGFCVQTLQPLSMQQLDKLPIVTSNKQPHEVLQKWICKDINQAFNMYLTGHGYHQESGRYGISAVAGMSLQAFHNFLQFLQKEIKTNLLLYSSCYSSGVHLIKPYHVDAQDLRLNYTVIVASLTDAPTYVFGVPSGVKLPPYDSVHKLTEKDVSDQGLQHFLMQDFNQFCQRVQQKKYDKKLVQTVSPYLDCYSSSHCTFSKVENLPLIRKKKIAYFVPLDTSRIAMIQHNDRKAVDVGNKEALLLYSKQYAGKIIARQRCPTFVAMIPGDHVYHMSCLDAGDCLLSTILKQGFCSIEDLFGQNMYLFDSMVCKADNSILAKKNVSSISNVIIMPHGTWLPAVIKHQQGLHVYFEVQGKGYLVSFGTNKQQQKARKLSGVEQGIMKKFKKLLLQRLMQSKPDLFSDLLSSYHFITSQKLQQDLLNQCIQQHVCRAGV